MDRTTGFDQFFKVFTPVKIVFPAFVYCIFDLRRFLLINFELLLLDSDKSAHLFTSDKYDLRKLKTCFNIRYQETP